MGVHIAAWCQKEIEVQSEVPLNLDSVLLDQIDSLYGRGSIAVSVQGRIFGMSEFARLSLVTNRWPIRVTDEHLKIIDPIQHSKFLALLEKVYRRIQNVGGVMLFRSDADLPVFVTVTRSDTNDRLFLTVRDPLWVGADDQCLLRQVFGYTRREAELASHLASGWSLTEFTEKHHLTENTVKSHLKQAFKKAGVRSQKQLAVVVLAVLR